MTRRYTVRLHVSGSRGPGLTLQIGPFRSYPRAIARSTLAERYLRERGYAVLRDRPVRVLPGGTALGELAELVRIARQEVPTHV